MHLLKKSGAALLVALVGIQNLRAAMRTEMVSMRDQVRLATDVYLPESHGPYPVILMRTPYNKNGLAGMGAEGVKRGFAVVLQDTRGRNASEGENLPYDGDGWGEHWDGFDTAEWIAKQPWCNGKIGTTGGSALSNAHFLLMGSGSDKISAEHHTVGSPSLFHDVIFPGGVFKKFLIEEWLSSQKYSPQALQTWSEHPFYDSYWHPRNARAKFYRANVPAVHIGGWFDIFTQGTLDAFTGYNTQGGPRARGHQKLIMGPWTHSIFVDQAGQLKFRNAKAPPTPVQDAWRWFDYTLRGIDNGMASEPAVTYYVMGDASDPSAPGNEWRTAKKWPPVPTQATPWYFHGLSLLDPRKPDANAPRSYRYNPADPAPTIGGPQNPPPNGPYDQSSIESRPDMLVFTSEVLNEPMEVTGRVKVKLWISSDCPDTDFFAKLCDVYPDGRSFNICEGQLRARFRDGLDHEAFLKPGKIYPIEIDLWSNSMIFNKGHRLRVDITSSSFPGYDPNPNTGAPFRADSRLRPARNSVWIDAAHPSHILLPVVK